MSVNRPTERPAERRRAPAAGEARRKRILEAAQEIFTERGLEGATLRAIAERAGCTTGAIYSRFEGKEDLYAVLLSRSLERLRATLEARAAEAGDDSAVEAAVRALYEYYAEHPDELALGLYLQRGIAPKGLGPDHDQALNAQLADALDVITRRLQAATRQGRAEAQAAVIALFAQVVGLVILDGTRRLKTFGVEAGELFEESLARLLAGMGATDPPRRQRTTRRWSGTDPA